MLVSILPANIGAVLSIYTVVHILSISSYLSLLGTLIFTLKFTSS